MSKAMVGFLDLGFEIGLDLIVAEDQEALLGTRALELIAKKFGIDFHKKELFFEGLNF